MGRAAKMSNDFSLKQTINPAIANRADKYDTVEVDTVKVLKSYRKSLFSYEWLTPEGAIKTLDGLSDSERVKRQEIEDLIAHGKPVPMPVLGIGVLNNVEIGIGRAAFLTLAAHGVDAIAAHIPKSNAKEFRSFLR
jgi:hypothetical protein